MVVATTVGAGAPQRIGTSTVCGRAAGYVAPGLEGAWGGSGEGRKGQDGEDGVLEKLHRIG